MKALVFTPCFEERLNHDGLAAFPAAVRWRSLESQPVIMGLGEEERGGGSGQTSAPETEEPVDTAAPPLEVFTKPLSVRRTNSEERAGWVVEVEWTLKQRIERLPVCSEPGHMGRWTLLLLKQHRRGCATWKHVTVILHTHQKCCHKSFQVVNAGNMWVAVLLGLLH